MVSVTVELTGETADRLKQAAAARGVSAEDLVGELVAEHVAGRRRHRSLVSPPSAMKLRSVTARS